MNRTPLISLFALLLGLAPLATLAADSAAMSKADLGRYNLGLGRVVFTEQCIKCHREPESEAPQLGKVDDWQIRLEPPVSTLIDHAIHGHGKMPPKGDLEGLTDRHVAAAVAYVVDQGRSLFVEYKGKMVPLFDQLCADDQQTAACRQSRLDNTLLLQMLWLITGQERE